MKTAVVERDKVGGRCLNYACIPAKAVLRSADLLSEVRDAHEFGLKVNGVEVDYPAVQARREKVVATLVGGVNRLFKKNGIDLIEAHGTVTDAHNVRLGSEFDGTEIQAGTVILATGSVRRAIPGVQFGGRVIGTEEAWALSELPARLAVVGAGASGAEIASGYARLGSEVILLEMLDRVLPTEDADISRLVERGLKRQGIQVATGAAVEDVNTAGSTVKFSYGGESAEVDYLVIAAGRGADVEALGLGEAGVELGEQGLVQGRWRAAHHRQGRLRDRRPRARSRARTQGIRRGHHRRRGRRRTGHAPALARGYSRAPPSARPTSAPSGSPRKRRASRATMSSSARSPTARWAGARCTATAPAS